MIDLFGSRPNRTTSAVAEGTKAVMDTTRALISPPGGPPGLRAIRESWLADLTGRSRMLDGAARTLGVLDALSSSDPAGATTRLAVRTVVADIVSRSIVPAVEAARRQGVRSVAGSLTAAGFAAGQIAGSGVDNIVLGFVDTDVKRYAGARSLGEMLRSNSRTGRETYFELRREGSTIAGAVTVGMWRTLGSDLRAFSYYLARDVLERK